VDIIISDVEMPDGDGPYFLNALAKRFRNFEVPQFFFASGGSKYSEEELLGMGAVGFFQKPYRSHMLLAEINSARNSILEKERIPTSLTVRYASYGESEISCRAVTINLAQGGMCLVTDAAPLVPAELIHFIISHGGRELAGRGEVRWTRSIKEQHHNGVKFIKSDQQENLSYAEFFFDVKENLAAATS